MQNNPLYYVKNLFIDPRKIKKDSYWYKKIKETQINKKIPLFSDRQNEIKSYFKLKNKDLLNIFQKYGFPNSKKYKQNLMNFFEGRTKSDKALKNSYKDAAFLYTLRLMLAYERYSLIIPYLDYIIKDSKKTIEKFKVLDYGCGVSGIGLLLASLKANVTIADLDDEKFVFTIWRYKKRSLSPNIIKIKNISDYPEIPKNKFDLIIATELFEHVRDPLRLLKNFTNALKKGGYLFDSMGGEFEREVGGDHLAEAIKIGNSKEFKDYYKKHFKHIKLKYNLNYLFKKI